MSNALVRRLDEGRWHFQHGPIDCIVGADGDPAAIASAIERAGARFGTVLDELVGELALLRTDLASPAGASVQPGGPIARRMVAACRPHAAGGRFIRRQVNRETMLGASPIPKNGPALLIILVAGIS